MPRPIFNTQQATSLGTGPVQRTQVGAGAKVRTVSRSRRFVEAIGRLDASAQMTPGDLADVTDALHREFADSWASVPQGFVAHCYLGVPYEVHTVTIAGQIIEHYQRGQAMPGPLESARSLARTENYLVIEVYTNQLVCVRTDGSVVTLGV